MFVVVTALNLSATGPDLTPAFLIKGVGTQKLPKCRSDMGGFAEIVKFADAQTILF